MDQPYPYRKPAVASNSKSPNIGVPLPNIHVTKRSNSAILEATGSTRQDPSHQKTVLSEKDERRELLRVASLYQRSGDLQKSTAIYNELLSDSKDGIEPLNADGIVYIRSQVALTLVYEGA